MRNELNNNNNKTRRRTNMVTNKKTNKTTEGMNPFANPSGCIYTEFDNVEEKERFEKETGFLPGTFFTISNRQYRTLKKRCRRGKTAELITPENMRITIKKYGKDLYKDVDTGSQVLSSKMIDKRIETFNTYKTHNGISELFADNEMGHLSQSLSDKGFSRDEVSEFIDDYLDKKHNRNQYKEVA